MKTKNIRHSLLALGALMALTTTNAFADKYKANNLTTLNLAASWTNNAVPGSSEYGVWDATVAAPNTTNSLGADMTWGGIKIINPGGPVTLVSGNTLTLNGVSGTSIDMSSATQDLTVNCGLTLAASQSFIDPTNRMLTVGGVISGAGVLTKSGFGTLTLSGNNAFGGDVTINAGPLWIKHSNALGTGPKTVICNNGTVGHCQLHLDGTGGNLTLPSGINYLVSNWADPGTVYNEGGDNVINGNFTVTSGGGGLVFLVNAGSLTLNSTISPNTSGRGVVFVGAGNCIVNGVISDGTGGSMTFLTMSTGTTTLNATNTYTGTTEVRSGTLLVNGSLASASVVTVKTNATLGGNGLIRGPVTVQAGATLSPGIGIGWIGRMAISNTLSLAGTTVMDLNKAAATNDQVRGITTLTYGGTLMVTNLAGTLAAGDSFKLFDATHYTGSFATISPATPGIGIGWDMSRLPVDGTLRIATAPPNITQAAIQAGAFSITFQSQVGFTYDIEYKNSLTDPSWNVLLSVVASTELTTVWDSPLQQSCRFYRVVCRGMLPGPATPFEPPTPPITSPGASCGAAQDDSMPYLFSGEFHQTVKDLVIKSRGIDVVWGRTYRSKAGQDTAIGNGWSFSYDIRVQANGPDFDVYDGTGRKDSYRLQTNGTYAADQLFYEGTFSNNIFVVKFPDTGTWEFLPFDASASQGKISRITDRNGNADRLIYDPLGRLLKLVDTQNRTNQVSYNTDGFVSVITDFAGRHVIYTYYQNGDAGGSFGDLKSVTSPAVTNTPNGNDFPAGKTITYTYTKGLADQRLNHNLLTITDAKGQTWLRNTYAATTNSADYNFDRLMSQARGYSNQVITFCYRPQSPAPDNGFAIIKTIVNDQIGDVSEHYFDATNRQVLLRQYTGRAVPGVTTTETENPPVGRLRASDPSFFDIYYAWNNDSKPVSIIYPNGNSVTNIYEGDLNPNAPLRSRGNLRVRTTLPGSLGGDQTAITETFVYDTTYGCGCGFNFATQVADGRGNITYHSYDSHGNRTNTIYPVSSTVEDFEYNSYGQMTSHVLPDNGSGHRRRDVMTYYTSGPQTGYLQQSVVDANGFALITSYQYDAVGNIIRVIDPNGDDSTNVVNQLNQVVREYSRTVSTSNGPVRYQRDFFYDANNNDVRLDVQNIDENGVVSSNAYLTTTYAYDILNRVTNVTQEVDSSHNVVTRYAYDAIGNRILVVNGEASNGHQPNNIVSTLYDERNLPFQEVRALGDPGQSKTQSDYDGNGNLIRTSQGLEDLAAPRVTTYAYDGYNRHTTTTDAMGNLTTTHYDANGNVASSRVDGELTDLPGSAGNVRLAETTYTYDAMNRRVQTDQAFFDPATGINIAGGHALTTTVYSPSSQVIATIDANSHSNSIAYDTANRPSVAADAKGNTRTSVYDTNGNVVLAVEVDLSDLGSPAQTFYTTNVYDGQDRLIQTTDNLGNTTRFAYDSRNNRATLTDPRGNLTRYTYDGLNRLITTTRILTSTGEGGGTPIGSIVTRQSWDDNSRLTGQTDANSNTTVYVYDSLNRMTATVFADGTTNGIAYDAHHNPTRTADANGNVVNATFDLLNRVATKTITRGPGVLGTTTETYANDGLSRIVLAANDDSLVMRSHDSLSHVTRETQQVVSSGAPARVVSSTYDALGNRLSCTYPGGRVINCTHDSLNRKQAVSDSFGIIASYSYYGLDRVQRRDYGNGTRADYAYDGLRRLTNSHQSVIVGGAPIDYRAYAWDAVGNKTAVNDLLAPALDSKSFAYDSVNRLINSRTAVVGPTNAYTFDGVGNRLTVTGENTGNYFMNPAIPPADFQMNQYTTTPFDVRSYDANGNLVNAGSQQFYYDYRNRLVGIWQPTFTNSIGFKYNCFGRRVEKATSASVARFYYTGWQEIEEQDGVNATAATFIWGNRIDELLSMGRAGQEFFYHADGLDSIRKVTDLLGGVVEQYRYSDYGEPSFFDGTNGPLGGTAIGNSTLFTGRRYDPETGFYYYRTRYLDPVSGRFTTRDWIGIWGDPANCGNAYSYGGNNPYSSVDPFGRNGFWEWLGGVAWDVGCALLKIPEGIGGAIAYVFDPVTLGTGDVFSKEYFQNQFLKQYGLEMGPFGPQLPTVIIRCFVAGTLVETPSGSKSIEEIAVGDWVLSGNAERDEVENAEVVALPEGVATNLVCIEVNGEQICCTSEHRFWVCGKGWVRAKRLEPGFLLVTKDWKPLPITDVSFLSTDAATRVYNLTVTGQHTYFVGKSGYLVHNAK